MVMNHYERNDSRVFGITGVCSFRIRVDEHETCTNFASNPGGDWPATVHGAEGLDGDGGKIVMSHLTSSYLCRHINNII